MVFLAFLEIISIGAVVPVVGILIDPSFVSQNEILKKIYLIISKLQMFKLYLFCTTWFINLLCFKINICCFAFVFENKISYGLF